MQNIDYLTLKAFFDENIDFFINSRLQKIQQPTRRELILHIRNNGANRKFYVNINPQFFHVAFMSKENEKRRNIEIPQKPPMFCMLLRKYIEGCKIVDACVIENERILELYFETYNEISEMRSLCLCIELMGKHSNIILYDRNTKIIIGCAHNVGTEKSQYRELTGGVKYIYPPKVNQQSDVKTPLYKTLSENKNTINENIDNYFAEIQESLNIKNQKNSLTSIVNTKLKKIKSSENKIQTLLNKRDNIEIYKLYGELLTANLYQKQDYQKNIEVLNYNTGENIIIELDETKTLNENAQKYFKLYTKSKLTKEKSCNFLQGLNIEKEYLENVLYSIEKAITIEELEEIKQEFGETKTTTKKEKPTITKCEINGFEVFIGKNNKQNDYIVSKIMKDNDLWFHTKMCAGSHVLLKVKDKEPDDRIIFECSKLAREFSSAKLPSKVGVIYTRGKFVKKPPSAPLGYVIYKNEKEILV